MGRPVRPELLGAHKATQRYFNYAAAEFRRIGYPQGAAFSKHIAKGTLAPAPTPDDPEMDQVGRYMALTLGDIEKRVVASHYGDGGTKYVKAHRIGKTVRQFDVTVERYLVGLTGFMTACRVNSFT